MTFLELQQLVSDWLDDPNNGYFSLARVKVWINNGQKEAQKQLLQTGEQFYTICVETPTIDEQSHYILPDDFLKLHRLEIITSGSGVNEIKKTLVPITLNQQDLLNQAKSVPDAYTIKKNRLILFDPPDSSSYTLRMQYSYLVEDMVNDNDEPDVPPQYHEYLAVLAVIDGAIKDKSDPGLILEKKKYYEELLKKDAEDRRVDVPRSVVITEEDY